MRVSTSQIYNIATLGISQAQSSVTKIQEQMATGKKVLSPADDPVAATTILQLNQELARTEQYKKNIDIAENNLNLEESSLQTIVSLVQRMRQIAVSAGNTAVLTQADYAAYAAEVEARMDELLNLQNTRNASGQYIFAGYQSSTKPFTSDGGGNFSYLGDEGQLRLQASASVSVPVSDSGKKLFVDVPSGHNTFTTSASTANKALPPAMISVGEVIDQEAFDRLYPDDLVISFNRTGLGVVFSVTEKTSGKQLITNQTYIAGQDIEVAGARFRIVGNPYSGEPAVPATLNFGSGASFPVDFSAAPTTLTVTVGARTETLLLDANVNSAADMAALLNSTTGTPSNQAKLAALGVTLTPTGFTVANGLNITVSGGNPDTDAALGFPSQGMGSASTNGVTAVNGDSFFVESTDKQGLLTTLSRFAQAMREVKDSPESKEKLAELVAKTLTNLESAITNLAAVQGDVGARLNTLESSRDLNLDVTLTTKTVLSSLQDLDYAEASIQLSMQSFVLSAAQQSFVKVSQLSLFSYF
ncbi:flagellar hook-associated protein FlgL [Cellvibrio japonicus]|uniref:Flagellar hook-associated protein type 3 FlgL n=1 Tax=Cellvibrio japonicus (strain Ueda107) TaxID=498211 RepID=B3PGR8_CELJU|nr:flagellar hook-associated protein FlgL [Cellvibrio japonicus]ACE84092.1 flagellar hook-associated protein type 3 FlgL [Cellvibrio japonicus Ueda107]QEI12413.1 flagellar hook-associated protein 3 [Cellvibrio japonicus]QEI15986.1 flagellar hook-associated protein 3 [Cellvibrio japonicus]QEI19565.1 flagellar hook-associated protein 3 [Cellvibrio japonicus]